MNTTNSSTPLSSVPIQFVMKVAAAPPCTYVPRIVSNGSTCIQVKVNQTFVVGIYAINECGPSVAITDIASVSLVGMRQSAIQQVNSSLFYKSWTWIPSLDQLGYQIMCTVAFNR